MVRNKILMLTVLMGTLAGSGCLSSQVGKLLPAPSGAKPAAARHHDAGIQAYNQGQWDSAKQHFEAAINVSPMLAEAHYNLGMVLYKMGAEGDANARDSAELYQKLRWVIAPLFFQHHEQWVDVMRHTIAFNGSFFNTHRMVQQYAANAYV